MALTLTVGPDRASRGLLFLLRVLQRAAGKKVAAVELVVKVAAESGVPSFTSGEETFTEVNTIARALATALKGAKLLGDDAFTQSKVAQWLAFSASGSASNADLAAVNSELATVSYLAGNSVTVADIVTLWALRPSVAALTAETGATLLNLLRWFDQVQHDALVAGVASGPAPVDLSYLQAIGDKLVAAALASAAADVTVLAGAGAGVGAGAGSAQAAAAKPAAAKPAAAKGGAPGISKEQQEKQAAKKAAKAAKKAAKAAKNKGQAAKGGKGGKGKKGGAAAGDVSNLSKAEFKVGKIIKCWEHPEADKLLVEEIECGEDAPRTIVSGLKAHYKPEELTGKLVVIASNLKPRPFVGIKSNGMVVCAKNETSIVTLVVPEGTPLGERVAFEGHVGEPVGSGTMTKKKILEKYVLPNLSTDAEGVVMFKNEDGSSVPATTTKGKISASLKNAHVG